jgi:hypothetical protein
MSELIPAQPLDVVQWVTVRLHASGTISTTGTIGDKKMALYLLAQAKDAVTGLKEYGHVIIPGSEVCLAPVLPVLEMGDIRADQRGCP